MLAGVGVLGFGSLTLGLVGGPLADLLDAPALPSSAPSLALSLAAVAIGALSLLVAARVPTGVTAAFQRQLFIDEGLRTLVQRPLLAMAGGLDVVERRGFDAAVDGFGRATVLAARGQDWIERRGIDAAVDGLARRVGRGGDDLRRLQSGRLYEYLRDAVLGAAAVVLLIALTALL